MNENTVKIPNINPPSPDYKPLCYVSLLGEALERRHAGLFESLI